jgi:hypothetical protein
MEWPPLTASSGRTLIAPSRQTLTSSHGRHPCNRKEAIIEFGLPSATYTITRARYDILKMKVREPPDDKGIKTALCLILCFHKAIFGRRVTGELRSL